MNQDDFPIAAPTEVRPMTPEELQRQSDEYQREAMVTARSERHEQEMSK